MSKTFMAGLDDQYVRVSAINAVRIRVETPGHVPGQPAPEDQKRWRVDVLVDGNWIAMHRADSNTMARNWISTELQ